MTDPFGKAIEDFHQHGVADDILIHTNYTENESIPVSYFFRSYEEMPEIEQIAMNRAVGKVLDIGSAAGCHSIYLQGKGIDVSSLEMSEKSCEVMKSRGLKKIIAKDIFDYSAEKYDTLLLLMNGAGIGQTLKGLGLLFLHLKTLLKPDGQILLDSSDIKYLFEEEDGSYWLDLNSNAYYGEMQYDVHYKNLNGQYQWLFIDFSTLKRIAEKAGYNCSKVADGANYDFLARLSPKPD